jgi:hypothetical protein
MNKKNAEKLKQMSALGTVGEDSVCASLDARVPSPAFNPAKPARNVKEKRGTLSGTALLETLLR